MKAFANSRRVWRAVETYQPHYFTISNPGAQTNHVRGPRHTIQSMSLGCTAYVDRVFALLGIDPKNMDRRQHAAWRPCQIRRMRRSIPCWGLPRFKMSSPLFGQTVQMPFPG
jgi:hypothetical protein